MFGIVELDTYLFIIVRRELIDGFYVKSTPIEVHGFIRVEIAGGVIRGTSFRYISEEVIYSDELEALRLEARKHVESYWGGDV